MVFFVIKAFLFIQRLRSFFIACRVPGGPCEWVHALVIIHLYWLNYVHLTFPYRWPRQVRSSVRLSRVCRTRYATTDERCADPNYFVPLLVRRAVTANRNGPHIIPHSSERRISLQCGILNVERNNIIFAAFSQTLSLTLYGIGGSRNYIWGEGVERRRRECRYGAEGGGGVGRGIPSV